MAMDGHDYSSNRRGRSGKPGSREDSAVLMDQTGHQSEFRCWATPKCRHVHDDPFAKRRLPYPLRLTGSVLFTIWLHLIFIGVLSTAVVVIDKYADASIAISPTLTSIIGFVVALSINFRNQTAYERWTEGRRLWNQLQLVIRNLGRIIWLQAKRSCSIQAN